jgi:predicted DNA-binding protein YlxM (UPF0122 family)
MKPDKLNMALYYDTYGDLLTEKQRESLDLYCNQDYTLAEIAELQGTSRQSVYDAISRAQAQLLRLEEVTHCIANARRRLALASELEELSRQLRQHGAARIPQTLTALESVVREIKE